MKVARKGMVDIAKVEKVPRNTTVWVFEDPGTDPVCVEKMTLKEYLELSQEQHWDGEPFHAFWDSESAYGYAIEYLGDLIDDLQETIEEYESRLTK